MELLLFSLKCFVREVSVLGPAGAAGAQQPERGLSADPPTSSSVRAEAPLGTSAGA